MRNFNDVFLFCGMIKALKNIYHLSYLGIEEDYLIINNDFIKIVECNTDYLTDIFHAFFTLLELRNCYELIC